MDEEKKNGVKQAAVRKIKNETTKDDRVRALVKEYQEVKARADNLTKEDSEELNTMFKELVGIVEKGNGELKKILQNC